MFLSASENDLRKIVQSIRELWQGRSLAPGLCTLTPSTTTTAVSAANCGDTSKPYLTPRTANAAAALATTYISSVARGSFVITHASNSQTDRNFFYGFQG